MIAVAVGINTCTVAVGATEGIGLGLNVAVTGTLGITVVELGVPVGGALRPPSASANERPPTTSMTETSA
jgi:hypothetical protein